MSDFQFSEIGMNWINGDLEHSAKGTSWEKKDHKYIEKGVKEGRVWYKYNKKTGSYEEHELTKSDLKPIGAYEKLTFSKMKLVEGTGVAQEWLLNQHGIRKKETLLEKSIVKSK